jgi:hypothetical protein
MNKGLTNGFHVLIICPLENHRFRTGTYSIVWGLVIINYNRKYLRSQIVFTPSTSPDLLMMLIFLLLSCRKIPFPCKHHGGIAVEEGDCAVPPPPILSFLIWRCPTRPPPPAPRAGTRRKEEGIRNGKREKGKGKKRKKKGKIERKKEKRNTEKKMKEKRNCSIIFITWIYILYKLLYMSNINKHEYFLSKTVIYMSM